jgi:antitoxin PrlF
MKARGTPRTTPRTKMSQAAPVAFGVVMADRGRLVLPVEVRERVNIKPGDRLTLRVEPDGKMTLLTAAAFARSLRGVFKHLGVPGRSMADELIAERRREAAMEERDTQAMLARARRRGRRLRNVR